MKIATNETLFQMTCQLWKEAYCHEGESLTDLLDEEKNLDDGENTHDSTNDPINTFSEESDVQDGILGEKSFKWHPFGAFDCNKGYAVRCVT